MEKTEKFSAFVQKIVSGKQLAPYLFFVSENSEDLSVLLKAVNTRLTLEFGACDEVHLSGLDNEAATWHAELMTLPMFPTGRLILVRHAELLLKRIETQAKVLTSYATDLPRAQPFVVSILQFNEKKIPKKLQMLEELAQCYEEMPANPDAIAQDLLTRAMALGYKTDREVMELLVERSAGIQKAAYANFDRLITYRLHEKELSTDDVLEISEQSESNLHFRLLDETARRNIGACLQIFERHALGAAEAFIAALSRLFSEALRYHYYRENGMELQEIGAILTGRPLSGYALKKTAERCTILVQKYSPQGIRLVMDALVKADQLCKETSAQSDQQVIITSLYLMLSRAA